MPLEIFDCEQNTPEWLEARLGIPTASQFGTVLAKGQGKTRTTYMHKLAGEIITGEPMDSISNRHTERGHALEPEARDTYALIYDEDPRPVGFIRNGRAGASPDSLVDPRGLLEIKTKLAHLMIEVFLRDELPPEHKAQVQGQMWIAEREWNDLVVYHPKMRLPRFRVVRDEPYIANLAGEIDRFNDELDAIVERVRSYGDAGALRRSLEQSIAEGRAA